MFKASGQPSFNPGSQQNTTDQTPYSQSNSDFSMGSAAFTPQVMNSYIQSKFSQSSENISSGQNSLFESQRNVFIKAH